MTLRCAACPSETRVRAGGAVSLCGTCPWIAVLAGVTAIVNDMEVGIGMNEAVTSTMNQTVTSTTTPTPEALLAAAERLDWPAVRVGGVRVKGGEVAWRQLTTLAGPEARAALARALEALDPAHPGAKVQDPTPVTGAQVTFCART